MNLTFTKLTMAVACAVLIGASATAARAATLASWTFETSVPATAGPHAAEVGAGAASGFHATSTVYSNPVGNGSAESFSSNGWGVGDYYQFQISTTGFQDIQISWDQTSSSTGPRDFALQYSTNGTTFTNFGSDYVVLANASPNPVWNSTTSSPIYSTSQDLSSIGAIENVATVYFRLTNTSTVAVNGSTVAGTGTNRVDNVTISGIAVPEPSSMVLAGLGMLGAVLALRRRTQVG
jgi:hypothetical protein